MSKYIKRFVVLLVVAVLVVLFTQIQDSLPISESNESTNTAESELLDESTLETQFSMMTDNIKYDLSKIPEFTGI